mgnify:CR=1 FL=1
MRLMSRLATNGTRFWCFCERERPFDMAREGCLRSGARTGRVDAGRGVDGARVGVWGRRQPSAAAAGAPNRRERARHHTSSASCGVSTVREVLEERWTVVRPSSGRVMPDEDGSGARARRRGTKILNRRGAGAASSAPVRALTRSTRAYRLPFRPILLTMIPRSSWRSVETTWRRAAAAGSAHRRAVRFAQRFELALVVRRRLSLGPLGVS